MKKSDEYHRTAQDMVRYIEKLPISEAESNELLRYIVEHVLIVRRDAMLVGAEEDKHGGS